MTDWWDLANCLGLHPDLFFPGRNESAPEARDVCYACESQRPCLEYALAEGERFGIWGGASAKERIAIGRGRLTVDEIVARSPRSAASPGRPTAPGPVAQPVALRPAHGTRERYRQGCACAPCLDALLADARTGRTA